MMTGADVVEGVAQGVAAILRIDRDGTFHRNNR